ncbi:MAG: hypothetical protein QM654_10550 [Dysgonamonadaceae bacterium]
MDNIRASIPDYQFSYSIKEYYLLGLKQVRQIAGNPKSEISFLFSGYLCLRATGRLSSGMTEEEHIQASDKQALSSFLRPVLKFNSIAGTGILRLSQQ